ncbi:MAG: glycosyltransferase family 9 protein [Chloroflexi bacterium]|nr:glycosyltransferase family 9 protein [Chloroflexota bacterium]
MRLNSGRKRVLLKVAEPAVMPLVLASRLGARPIGRSPGPPAQPERILVVRLDTIGDVLLSEPAIAALRARFPSARVDLVVGGAGAQVLQGHPAVDRFVVYRAPWHAAWRGQRVDLRRELRELWAVLAGLRRTRYDLAVELRGDFRDILFAALSGARWLAGNSWRGGAALLDQDVPVDVDTHRVEWCLGIAGGLGCDTRPRPPALALAGAHREAALRALDGAGTGPRVAVHLGAGFASKCLPVATFAAALEELARRHGAEIVVIGGPEDRNLAEELSTHLRRPLRNLVGRLSLLETAATIEQCHLFVGNDSGPMHLAAAVGTPVVTFFGPSEPWRYHPYGVRYRLLERDLSCRPCDHVHCVHGENRCLTQLSPASIVTAAEALLRETLERTAERNRTGDQKEVSGLWVPVSGPRAHSVSSNQKPETVNQKP